MKIIDPSTMKAQRIVAPVLPPVLPPAPMRVEDDSRRKSRQVVPKVMTPAMKTHREESYLAACKHLSVNPDHWYGRVFGPYRSTTVTAIRDCMAVLLRTSYGYSLPNSAMVIGLTSHCSVLHAQRRFMDRPFGGERGLRELGAFLEQAKTEVAA